MKDLNLDDSKKLYYLIKNKEIKFIALAVSPWHAIGINAFIYDHFLNSYNKINGIVIIASHPKDGYIIDKNNFLNNIAKINYFQIQENLTQNIYDLPSILQGLINIKNNRNGKEIYLISPLDPKIPFIKYFKNRDVSNKYCPIFVVIDEGFGTYVSKEIWKMIARHEKNYHHFGEIKLIIFSLVRNFLEKISLKYIPLEQRFLSKSTVKFEIDETVLNSYKKVLKLMKREIPLKNKKNNVLLITQPFSEYNQIPITDEFKVIESLIKLLSAKNFNIILKTHPREKEDKYLKLLKKYPYITIIQDNFPVEEIFSSLNPICVIGYTSTALITAKLFHDIPSISLANILLSISNDELLNMASKEFINLTGEFIQFVEKFEEIFK